MMYHDLQNAIERLYRRVLLIVGRGRITTVDDSVANIQYMQVMLGQDETRDKTPRLAEYGFSSNPPPGSDAVMLFVGGDRSNGVIIATGNQSTRPTGLAPGESMLYNSEGQYVKLQVDGKIVIEANGAEVQLNNATKVVVTATDMVILDTPVLKVKGDIIDNYETNSDTMGNMRTIYNEHTHDGVQTGSGTTDIPNQEM